VCWKTDHRVKGTEQGAGYSSSELETKKIRNFSSSTCVKDTKNDMASFNWLRNSFLCLIFHVS